MFFVLFFISPLEHISAEKLEKLPESRPKQCRFHRNQFTAFRDNHKHWRCFSAGEVGLEPVIPIHPGSSQYPAGGKQGGVEMKSCWDLHRQSYTASNPSRGSWPGSQQEQCKMAVRAFHWDATQV